VAVLYSVYAVYRVYHNGVTWIIRQLVPRPRTVSLELADFVVDNEQAVFTRSFSGGARNCLEAADLLLLKSATIMCEIGNLDRRLSFCGWRLENSKTDGYTSEVIPHKDAGNDRSYLLIRSALPNRAGSNAYIKTGYKRSRKPVREFSLWYRLEDCT